MKLPFHISLPFQDPVLVFSLVLFIILLAPVILRKFRIPGIIGLIIAGVAIGPYGFHLLDRSFAIELFGTVGLLYIMFLAGLELELNEFIRNKYRSAVFGILTFAIPFGIGVPVCHFLLHFDMTASLLIASMFSTHTLVAYPVASRLGIIRNEVVAITVGGTIITDTAVLFILAVITGAVSGELDQSFILRLFFSVAAFAVIVFILFPPLVRWFFKNIEGEKASQYIFILALVFFSAFLAELAGIGAIVGAFMAGLTLNRLIPHTSPLMNRIEFVGNALFIPFFLISVGMLVDLKVLLKGPETIIIAGTLTTVALAGKWSAAFITQKIFGYSIEQRQLIFGLSSSHAAVTLAVILAGFNMGILNESVLNATIILILVTCLVSSFKTENAGRKIARITLSSESETEPLSREVPEKILVPIANPKTIEQLMDIAVSIRSLKSKQPITALSIVEDDEKAQQNVISSNEMLEKAIVHASATDTKVQVITRVDLNVASGISRTAKELLATIVVMGWSEKSNAAGRFFGTTLSNILHHSRQMIVVSRMMQPLNTFKRLVIVVPENAEVEQGFPQWVRKVQRLAKQAGRNAVFFSSVKSGEQISQHLLKSKININASFIEFAKWNELTGFLTNVSEDDLFIIINARKGTVSYNNNLDDLPGKLCRHFEPCSFVMIYPEQFPVRGGIIPAVDLEVSPVQEGLESISRIGKTVRKIFKGGQSE